MRICFVESYHDEIVRVDSSEMPFHVCRDLLLGNLTVGADNDVEHDVRVRRAGHYPQIVEADHSVHILQRSRHFYLQFIYDRIMWASG